MSLEKFKEIIDFAIEREIEAADFYHDMQVKVKNDASITMLQELEQMELGHVNILRSFDYKDTAEGYQAPFILNMKISDYMVVPNKGDNITYQDIFVMAMKREEAANKLYLTLAGQTDNLFVKDIFTRLASEEMRHKNMLETMYDDEILKEN